MVKHEIDGHLVELHVDVETDTWRFSVPDLDLTGGGQKLLEEATQAAADAIAFALEELEDGQVRRALERLGYGQAEIEAGRGLTPDEVRAALGRPAKDRGPEGDQPAQ